MPIIVSKTFQNTSRRKKDCPLSYEGAPKVDYKDLRLLGKYLSDTGKMIPARITSVSAKKQRELSTAVKRARYLALIPYVTGQDSK